PGRQAAVQSFPGALRLAGPSQIRHTIGTDTARGLGLPVRGRVYQEGLRASVVPGDRELILGVGDPLLELPAVGRRLAAVDSLELGLGLLQLAAGAVVVDVLGADGVVDERDRLVLRHLEEARPGRKLEDLDAVAEMHTCRARLQQRDEGRVPREDADLPRL